MRAKAEPTRRSRVRDGFVIARHDHRVLILLLMVAAVTVADDPILVLGPALAKQLHASPAWSGWFIAALGAGTVLSSFRRVQAPAHDAAGGDGASRAGSFMLLFVHAPTIWFAALAALGAGASCLIANSVTRAALAEHVGPEKTAAVMAVWAIAWAGSKPFASLIDGTLGSRIGPQWTGLFLATPAFIPIMVIVLSPGSASAAKLAAASPVGELAGLTPGLARRVPKISGPLRRLAFHRQTSHHI